MKHAAIAALLTLAAAPAAGDFLLNQPIDCVVGDTCYIQHLPDRDPGPEVEDFACGTLSYDGHKGTDFALPTLSDMQAGVDVLAAVDGIVVGTRDGMPDQYATAETASDIQGRECGNGIVLRHDDGWETQYCHLRQGSIRVAQGDQVSSGDILGQVGLSGQTQFPHLHMSVRQDGHTIDPFSPDAVSCGPPVRDLWVDTPLVTPGGIIYAGFTTAIPEYDSIKAGTAAQAVLRADAPALVLFGFAFGNHPGDKLRMDIDGPTGPFMRQDFDLTNPQAQLFRATGRRLAKAAWTRGTYRGTVTLERNGKIISQGTATVLVE